MSKRKSKPNKSGFIPARKPRPYKDREPVPADAMEKFAAWGKQVLSEQIAREARELSEYTTAIQRLQAAQNQQPQVRKRTVERTATPEELAEDKVLGRPPRETTTSSEYLPRVRVTREERARYEATAEREGSDWITLSELVRKALDHYCKMRGF